METYQATYERVNRFFIGLSTKYEPSVVNHLTKVYAILGGTVLFAGVGAFLQLNDMLNLGFPAVIMALLLGITLHFQQNQLDTGLRLGMLMSFGFSSGQALAPLFGPIEVLNEAIRFSTVSCVAGIFISLTFASLLAERGQFLCMEDLLISVINSMAVMSILNIFFQSVFIRTIQLYIGIYIVAASIILDTQSIIEQCRCGNQDAIQHALVLFFNIQSLVRKVLLISLRKIKDTDIVEHIENIEI